MMGRDIAKNTGEGADLDRIVMGHDLMALAALLGRHSKMRAALPTGPIAERLLRLDQLRAGDVARQFHRARISSRTKCSRITFGASIVSSK